MMNERIYYSKEAELQAQRHQIAIVTVFMLLGLTIGTVIALLFAPQSGEKTRHLIGDAVEEGLESGRESTRGTLERLEHEFTVLRKQVEDKLH